MIRERNDHEHACAVVIVVVLLVVLVTGTLSSSHGPPTQAHGFTDKRFDKAMAQNEEAAIQTVWKGAVGEEACSHRVT